MKEQRGSWEPWLVEQCGSNEVVTGTPQPDICFPRPPLGLWAGEFLRDSWKCPQDSQGSMQVS